MAKVAKACFGSLRNIWTAECNVCGGVKLAEKAETRLHVVASNRDRAFRLDRGAVEVAQGLGIDHAQARFACSPDSPKALGGSGSIRCRSAVACAHPETFA
jgi:hypothetical protein